MINGAFWRYLKLCFYFSILWLSICLYRTPYIHICIAFFAFKVIFFGFQFKSLLERVNGYATLRALRQLYLLITQLRTTHDVKDHQRNKYYICLYMYSEAFPSKWDSLYFHEFRLRQSNKKLNCNTNTTKESKQVLLQTLIKIGFNISGDELFTSLTAARQLIDAYHRNTTWKQLKVF